MMTRIEVMAMSDEELRIKAAELMGWHYNGEENWRTSDGKSVRAITWRDPNGCITYGLAPPDYPNDIAAAKGLWSVLVKAGYRVTLFSRGLEYLEHYYCMVGRSVDDVLNADSERWTLSLREALDEASKTEIRADSKACAITRAFVLAMEDNDEED